MAFIRTKEDFTCGHCRKKVKGDGYTNHCPYCLWSKHVDNEPGDRANDCGGMMEPVRPELIGHEQYELHFKCVKCGIEKKKKALATDNFDAILDIIKKINEKILKG